MKSNAEIVRALFTGITQLDRDPEPSLRKLAAASDLHVSVVSRWVDLILQIQKHPIVEKIAYPTHHDVHYLIPTDHHAAVRAEIQTLLETCPLSPDLVSLLQYLMTQLDREVG